MCVCGRLVDQSTVGTTLLQLQVVLLTLKHWKMASVAEKQFFVL